MEQWVRTDRAGERRLKRDPKARNSNTARGRYARLMQVAIRHTYYSDDACPDFVAQPTPPTRDLMRSLGLLFQQEAAGFSVLYDVGRAEGLFWYLRQQGTAPGAGVASQHWTRLSFVLSLANLSFVNFTDIPVDTNPTRQNFYFTNQDAHTDGPDEIILNRGARVDGTALLPVEGPEIRIETPPGVDEVILRDIAGEPVLTVARCVRQVAPPATVCRDFVFLDCSTLPEDKYVIETVGLDHSLRDILYTVAKPVPLCFIDLLFASPTPAAPGVYPVQQLYPEHDTSITGVRYELTFQARSTYWRYYIQPQPPQKHFADLSIEPIPKSAPISFIGPVRLKLVNGAFAYRFVSAEPLRLQQRSRYWFKLLAADDVLVERLAVASDAQVLPEREGEAFYKTYSDIYVSV
jgi:hypothetical protein